MGDYYKKIRNELGMSRSAVEKKIYGIPAYRLARIENGEYRIHPDEVVALAECYGRPDMRNYYCCNECPIGKIDTNEVEYNDNVHEVLVDMAVSLRNVNHQKMRLMEILNDRKVSSDENADFQKIFDELEHISDTIEALQMWCEKENLT